MYPCLPCVSKYVPSVCSCLPCLSVQACPICVSMPAPLCLSMSHLCVHVCPVSKHVPSVHLCAHACAVLSVQACPICVSCSVCLCIALSVCPFLLYLYAHASSICMLMDHTHMYYILAIPACDCSLECYQLARHCGLSPGWCLLKRPGPA